MAYIECCRPPEDLVQLVKERLEERNMEGMLELMEDLDSVSSYSSSSDDEVCLGRNRKRRGGGSGQIAWRTEAIVCQPGSSLVAVIIQALAHRVTYAWVVEKDFSIVGIVTFAGMLKAFRDHISIFS
ncbi:hypothetical protein Dimus_032757 [Dionaea muscipula]